MADREFLFEYRFGGADWGISIHAADPDEAREKIKAVGIARYKGEVGATVQLGDPILWKWLVVVAGILLAIVSFAALKS